MTAAWARLPCLGLALLLLSGSAGWAQPFPVPASSAEAFVDSIGLNASPFERYLDSGRFKGAGTRYAPELFFDLGVRHFRTGLKNDLVRPEAPDLIANAFRHYGTRPLMLIDPGKSGSPEDLVREVKRYPEGVIWGLEGPNELNNKFPPQELNLKYKGKTDEAAGSAYMDDVVAALRADPATRALPVVAFTAIFSDYRLYRLAHPHGAFDFANMHSYQGDDVPSSSLVMNMARFNRILPAGSEIRPFMPTECGYNVEEDAANHTRVTGSLRAQALNISMLLAEYFRHGIPRSYLFALHNADGYGLLESDQATRRPAWFALKHFIAELADARWNPESGRWEGPSVEPRALLFDLEDAPGTVHALVLQKGDGSHRLLLWNEVKNFDQGTRQDLHPADVAVKLRFRQPLDGRVQVLRQNEAGGYDTTELAPGGDGRELRVAVPASVLILRLRQPVPSGTPPAAVRGVASRTVENEVALQWEAPDGEGSAAGYFVYCNGRHAATLPASAHSWTDQSPWIRPGLGYVYEVQAFDAWGRLSARSRHVAVVPDRHPDLVVVDAGMIEPSVVAGDAVTFWAEVRNAGSGATPHGVPVTATFSVDGKVISWGGVHRPLKPGESVRIEGRGGPRQPAVWTAAPGSHLLQVEADDINRISGEVSEGNNRIDRTLRIGAPGSADLILSADPAPAVLDIGQEGDVDWVQWGVGGVREGLVRGPGGVAIGPLSFVGSGHLASTPGGPVRVCRGDEAEGSHEALWLNGMGHGFAFEVDAGPEPRLLKVYAAGLEGATGRFRAQLRGGEERVLETRWSGNRGQGRWAAVPDGFSVCFSVRHRADRPGAKLRIEWILDDEPNRFLGQVRLQAATLQRLTEAALAAMP